MWEDVSVSLACLGFAAALVMVVAQLWSLAVQLEHTNRHD